MNRLAASLLGLLLTLSFGVEAAAQKKDEQPKRKFTRDIPRDDWVPAYFNDIDRVAKNVRLPTLRTPLREGEVELRVWEINTLTWPKGFRMRRTHEGWSASYFRSGYVGGRDEGYEKRLNEPKSGWEGAWKRLVGLGMLELPDAEAIHCISAGMRDGHSYVVETNVERSYRTYRYSNPEAAGCADAKRMVSVVSAIVEEFGLKEIEPYDTSPYRPRGGLNGRE